MYEKDVNKNFKRSNNRIRHVHDHKASIRIPKFDSSSFRINAYGDAVFPNNADVSSQLGRILLLTDYNRNSIPVSYKSYKLRRVACSVLSAEAIASADLFDDALTIRKQ